MRKKKGDKRREREAARKAKRDYQDVFGIDPCLAGMAQSKESLEWERSREGTRRQYN